MLSNYFRAAALLAIGLAVAGCTTMGNKTVATAPVTVPGEGERVSLHEVMVVVDASGSMFPGTSFAYAKALTQSMVRAFPDGTYRAGLLSFGGEWTFEWLDYGARPLDRPALEGASDDLKFIAGSTPLNEAIAYVGDKYFSRSANRALIVVSDGKTAPQPLLDTAVEMAYGGNLCIHTVQVGNDADGGKLLLDLASITPCGSYRHGDSIATVGGMEQFIRDVFFQDLAIIEVVTPEGVRGVLGIVYFDTDKSNVKATYNDLLDGIAGQVKSTPGILLSVQGHTDSTGAAAYNMGLSQRRADAVRAALLSRGVSPDRVSTKAYGEEMPAAPNTTRDGRQQNRRAEIAVIE